MKHIQKIAPSILVLFLSACTGKGGDEATTGVVWAGWNHTWERLSHRISAERAILNPDGSAELGMVGGDWSTGSDSLDFPNYRMHHTRVVANNFAVVHGETSVTLGPDGILSQTESIESPDIAAMTNQIVVLRGLDILTDIPQDDDYGTAYDPSLGYCSRGFGMAVSAPSVAGDTVSFQVDAEIRWGPAGEDDPLDRSDMNAAIPFAQTGLVVAWTVIGWEGSVESMSGTATVDYPNGVYSEQPGLTETDLGMAVTGASPGIPALRGFDLLVDVPENLGQGEYLRSYGVELRGSDGSPPAEVLTEATNSSLVETAAIRFTGEVDALWLSLSDATAEVTSVTIEGSHDVGYTSVSSD